MLDASKALLLFIKKLRLKGICPLSPRFIINIYISKIICVKWNDCISHEYAFSNGGKQGGVMAPFLFNLYAQDLIECHMGNILQAVLCMQMI